MMVQKEAHEEEARATKRIMSPVRLVQYYLPGTRCNVMRFPLKEIARILIGFWFGECDAFYPKFLPWLYRDFPEMNVCIQMLPFITFVSKVG